MNCSSDTCVSVTRCKSSDLLGCPARRYGLCPSPAATKGYDGLQRCRRRGCRGFKRTTKRFDLVKIREKSLKICENFRKIPENLGKLPENTGKNGAQRTLVWKKWRQTCSESHEDLFLEVIPKTVVMRNSSHKKWPKNFSGKFGKIRAKILRTPKNLPAPTRMVGLDPSNKVPSLPNWNMIHYKSVEFVSNLQNLSLPASCTNVKRPYWRLSGGGSAVTFCGLLASNQHSTKMTSDYAALRNLRVVGNCFIQFSLFHGQKTFQTMTMTLVIDEQNNRTLKINKSFRWQSPQDRCQSTAVVNT